MRTPKVRVVPYYRDRPDVVMPLSEWVSIRTIDGERDLEFLSDVVEKVSIMAALQGRLDVVEKL